MRLLFRHIKNSVLKAPYQTIVLLLTIFFSAVIFASVAEVRFAVEEEKRLSVSLKNGRADLVVEASAESASRYITFADGELGGEEYPYVSGYFALPMQIGEEGLLGGATDFDTIGNVFDFSFVEYQECSQAEEGSALFITRSFAEGHHLSLGDEVEVKLLGQAKQYVVRGISRYTFFGRYHLMVQAEGALGILSSVSPVFAAFDEGNAPCNYVYLRLKEGQNPSVAIQSLNERLGAFGWRASECENDLDSYGWKMTSFMMTLLLLLSMVIAWVLVGFSLRILSEKRQEEMRIFWLSGMPQNKIFFAFCVEIFLYLIIGTIGGVAFSVLFLRWTNNVGLRYARLALTWRGGLTAAISQLVVGSVSLLAYKLNSAPKGKRERKKGWIWLLLSGAAFVVTFLGGTFVPATWKIYFAVMALAFALLTLMLSAAPYCRGISAAFSTRFEGENKKRNPQFVLATKNCANIRELHNVYRILNIVLSLALILCMTFAYSNSQIERAKTYFSCDYVVLNAREAVLPAVTQVEGVESACAAFVGEGKFPNGEDISIIDADLSYFNGEGEMPQGKGICLSQAVADLYGYELGDEVVLEMFGKEYAFTLTGYSGKATFYAYIDADGYGFRKNTIFVKGTPSEQTLSNLTEELAVYGVLIGQTQNMLSGVVWVGEVFNELMGMYLALLFTLAAIGCVNLVWVCYARRKKQFSDLVMVGMTKKEVGKMIAYELAVVLLSVLCISVLCSGILSVALDYGLQSFGLRLFQ